MRKILLAAAITGCLTLTACGGSDDEKADGKPTTKKPSASSSVDCTDQSLSQEEWLEYCADADVPGGGTEGDTAKPLALGKPAETIGDGGTGVLEVTPTTVVYAKEGGGETPEYGLFAVVTIKDRATKAVAAAEAPPISGGGWKWIAPDGEAIDAGGGTSFNVVMDKYNNAGPVQPGSFHWTAEVFDLTPEQAKGGTLVYTDGEGTAYRWKVPAKDSGPQIDEVKQQLKF